MIQSARSKLGSVVHPDAVRKPTALLTGAGQNRCDVGSREVALPRLGEQLPQELEAAAGQFVLAGRGRAPDCRGPRDLLDLGRKRLDHERAVVPLFVFCFGD